jgi:hypothetical protein
MDDISITGSTNDMNNVSDTSDTSSMNETTSPAQTPILDLSSFNQVFSRLALQDIEQFQLLYQHWALQQQINDVQQEIAAVQRELADTVEQIERVHPSAIALATLARLQASGVEDIDLLDRMLERGEEWLDRTIQHLEYCEQLDVIRGDYEEWCRHALEDAFAWLDSMQSDAYLASMNASGPGQPAQASTPDGEVATDETTEELFLQKLMSEETDTAGEDANTGNADEKSEESSGNQPVAAFTDDTDAAEQPALEETTLKVAAIQPTAEVQDNSENETVGASLPLQVSDETPAATPESSAEDLASTPEPSLAAKETTPEPVVVQDAAVENTSPDTNNSTHTQEETAGRRSHFLQRFLSALWP